MGRMVRKQIYIEPRQEDMLKRRAKELGVPESVLIRHAVDQLGLGPMTLPLDSRAWEEEKQFIREHRMPDVPQTGRGWTRDDLYEERLGRFSN